MNKQKIKNNILKTKSFIGHKVDKNTGIRGLHPSMTKYIVGTRKNIPIIDVRFSLYYVVKTLYILFSIIKAKGHILVVNTNPEYTNLINNFALKAAKFEGSFSFCNSKWVGGALTNWNQISKSIIAFKKFSKRFGLFITEYNIHFPRYKKLKKSFQGFGLFSSDTIKIQNSVKKNVNIKKPDLLFIINPNENRIVLLEAKQLNIPVIALTDTNTNLSEITYPVPINANSMFVIHFYFSWILRILNKLNSRLL